MATKVGDRIIVESEKVGQHDREGTILEIIEAPYGTRFRVRWDDEHESTIRPAAGSARTVHPAKRRATSKNRRRSRRGREAIGASFRPVNGRRATGPAPLSTTASRRGVRHA